MNLKLATYNVNGIRAALKKGLLEWIKKADLDLLCLQESKARLDQVDMAEFEKLGYRHDWLSAEKKGYSGVITLSRINPDRVIKGCGIEKYDREGRIIRTDYGDLTVLNCYFPSGTTGELRQKFKYEFLDDFYDWIKKFKKQRENLIIVGDYNIAHTEMDIHNPKGNKNSSGFLPEERAWMSKWFDNGFTDSFRYLNSEKIEYSWWCYRSGARTNNKGWRLDYISVSDHLKSNVIECYHINEAVHSDHCPVYLEFDN